jgi:hypothetical protein
MSNPYPEYKRNTIALPLAEQPAQQEPVEKIISNLEPLLAAKNQSWTYAENMLLELLAAAPQPAQQEPVAFFQFLSDVVTAAGLLSHGKTDKRLAVRIAEFAFQLRTSPQPPTQRTWVGLTDDEIWKFWWSRPEVPEGEDDSMEAEFVAAVREVLAAHGITGERK